MASINTISIATAVIIDHLGRTLLVRKKGTKAFMQPGGKIEAGETALQSLQREIREELGASISNTRYLGSFSAPAANEPGYQVAAEVFTVELETEPEIGAEIAEMHWLDPACPAVGEIAPLSIHLMKANISGGNRA